MKKHIFAVILSIAMIGLSACGSSSQHSGSAAGANTSGNTAAAEAKQWAMGTSSSGSSPFVMGGALSKFINANQKVIKLNPQVTGGYEENISLVAKGSVHVAQATLDQLNDVYDGVGRYEGKPQKNVRALFNVTLMPLHLAVLEESGIKSATELSGKKVNIGSPKQATYSLGIKYLESVGISQQSVQIGQLSTKDAPEGLKDNNQDAIFFASTLPLPGLIEAAVSKPIRILPIEGKVADDFIEKAKGALIKTTIPGTTYKGMTEDVNSVASPIVLYVDQSASVDEVYEFTKTFWDNLEMFHKEFEAGASLKKEMAIQGIKVPLHPGAEKYFKEKGYIK